MQAFGLSRPLLACIIENHTLFKVNHTPTIETGNCSKYFLKINKNIYLGKNLFVNYSFVFNSQAEMSQLSKFPWING